MSDHPAVSPGHPDAFAVRADGVEIRDDKTTFGAPDDHRLVFTAEQFDGFLAGVRAGKYRRPVPGDDPPRRR